MPAVEAEGKTGAAGEGLSDVQAWPCAPEGAGEASHWHGQARPGLTGDRSRT